MIVADTNLVANLLIVSEQTALAELCLQRDPDWIAPPIWRHEFRNVLCTYLNSKSKPITREKAIELMAQADSMVKTFDVAIFDERVFDWCLTNRVAAYDAEFVEAARIAQVRVVTADTKLAAAVPAHVTLLSDFAAGR